MNCVNCGSKKNEYIICEDCLQDKNEEKQLIKEIYDRYDGDLEDLVKEHIKVLKQLDFWKRQAYQIGVMGAGS